MNRRSLILCLVALVIMAVAVVAAVFVLYKDSSENVPVEGRYELLTAIPADAVAVCCLSEVDDIGSKAFSGFAFPSALAHMAADGKIGALAKAPMAFSLHYSGKLTSLYVFGVGTSEPDPNDEVTALLEFGRANGMQVRYLPERSLVVMAETETLVKSSVRHLDQSLSVMDVAGFAKAADSALGKDVIFLSYSHAKPLFSSVFSRTFFNNEYGKEAGLKYSEFAGFLGTMGEWVSFSLEGGRDDLLFKGVQTYESDASEFVTVLDKSSGAVSEISNVLPSYTLFALTLPLSDVESYVSAYEAYLDSKQMLSNFHFRQNEMKRNTKVAPSDFIMNMGVTEVAKASFGNNADPFVVNLLRISKEHPSLTGMSGQYPYPSYVAAVFGKHFELDDESHYAYVDGWLVTGSAEAVAEYTEGRALEYTLKEYMADAGRGDLLAGVRSSLVAYMNLGEGAGLLSDLLVKDVAGAVGCLSADSDFSPMILNVYDEKGRIGTDVRVCSLTLERVKAPEHERDTVVVVPEGPFKVKNSGTGKMNLFYQNSNGAICLKEEGGKGLWGVPFGKPLCGTAYNVDYYANGKLQILFGSGSSIYLIDRLGRFVTGFPVDLGKEIRLGPDVYDFSGARAYNIMVLHKDNTIEMYNLKGRKPASWKGITASETIKALPERLEMDGSTFWVVRTSIQTLIFPFEGGAPVTSFEGQSMILPTSEIVIKDAASVEVQCYDGKSRTITLKK